MPTLYFDFFRKNHEIENKLVKIHQGIHTIFQWKSVCSAFQFNSSSFWQHVNLSNIPQYGSDTYNIVNHSQREVVLSWKNFLFQNAFETALFASEHTLLLELVTICSQIQSISTTGVEISNVRSQIMGLQNFISCTYFMISAFFKDP